MFTVELLEGMQARGDLVQDPDGYWVQTPTLDFLQVPARVEGLIEERIQRLTPAQRRMLDIATVGGKRFSAQLLARVQNSDVGQTILILSDELGHQHRVVYEDGIEIIAGTQYFYYQFQHALIRQYVYGQLANLKKRYLHGQVGEALEALYGTDSEEIAAELAHHFRQAGYPDKAISYGVQAGDRARRIGASDQAIVFYRNALADLAEIEPPPHQPAAYLIQERLGDVYLFHLSGHLQALEHYEAFLNGAQGDEETARGARKLGWVHLLHGNLSKAEALLQQALDNIKNLPPSPETNRVYCSLAYLYEFTHQLEEARAHATRGLEISNELEDLLGQANAHRELGNVASALGDQQTAFTHDIEALDRYRKLKDLPRIVQGCNNIGESYRRMGQLDTAQVLLNEGLELAQRIGNLGDSALLLVTLAEIQMDQGDWEAAREQLQKALQLAEKSGVVFRSIQANQNLADAYLQLGDLPKARSHLEAVMTLGEKTGHRRYNLRSALTQAALEAREGRIKEALATIEEARSFAGETAADHFAGLSSRVEGEIYRAVGDWEAAVKHLRQSVAHFEAAELPVEIAKTRLDLGQAYRCRDRKGDRARACEALRAAQATYNQIGAQTIVDAIKKKINELACDP